MEAKIGKPGISVEAVLAPTDEVRKLIAELDALLSREYSFEQRHGLTLEAIFTPRVRFFVAREDGLAVGCGGVALCGSFAEVKRMYVRAAARGRGVAQALLARIEAETAAGGIDTLRLETGSRQAAALRFYERSGFRPCGIFGDYASLSQDAIVTSVFLEKRLTLAKSL
jgi:putative acetyltransferase